MQSARFLAKNYYIIVKFLFINKLIFRQNNEKIKNYP